MGRGGHAPRHRQDDRAVPLHADGAVSKEGGLSIAAFAHVPSPADRYGALFTAVQTARVFDDSKTFCDCVPHAEPQVILAAFEQARRAADFDLAAFVRTWFQVPSHVARDYQSVPGQPIAAHIASLWPLLTRRPEEHPPLCSLLPLPRPYVVPGGRFRELYYWDSYFTMLGLGGDLPRLRDMVDNFAHLIDTYGHVPNGTRSYYLGRSQPPLFALMVELEHQQGGRRGVEHLARLQAEHAWWMRGEDTVAAGAALHRVVRLPDGAVLNRHWDERDTPREEAFAEDVATAAASGRPAAEVYRHLRAACESGWDFSTRWLDESGTLAGIVTTHIVPVDLNAFLFKLESLIAELATLDGQAALSQAFTQRAAVRREAVNALCWNAEAGAFFDHDWCRGEQRSALTAATVVPLFTGLSDEAQAAAVARTLERELLVAGGLTTTMSTSDEQWDRPNGWAPLQWMAICGLARHGQQALADAIAHRWLATVAAIYEREGKLVEKYALRDEPGERTHKGGGGEYPLQDGFGWTNGVTAALLAQHGRHSCHSAMAQRETARHR